MANEIQFLELQNTTYAQSFANSVITPIVYDYSSYNPETDTYFSTTGNYANTLFSVEVTVLQQCIAFSTLTITLGASASGIRTSYIQYFPYRGLSWITIAAHTVVGSASDGSTLKTMNCQVIRRFSEGDKIRSCAMCTLAGPTAVTLTQNVNTGQTIPRFTITRAVI